MTANKKLAQACETGDIELLKQAVAEGCDVNYVNNQWDETCFEEVYHDKKTMPVTTGTDFFFRYESYGFGNAAITMKAGTQEVVFHASYIGRNPLEDILEALAEMVCDEYDDCQLFWASEPGTLRVTIDKENANAHILVYELDQDVDYRKVKDAQWVKWIDTVIPLSQLVDVIVKEAERNLILHGLVGFSTDWCDHTDVFPISAYLRLKGIGYECGDDNLRKSCLEEELRVLEGLLRICNDDSMRGINQNSCIGVLPV